MSKNIFIAVLVLIFFPIPIPGKAQREDKQEIIVSAAISLTNAFQEIGKVFEEKQKEAKVLFNFGASGDLAMQIIGGAPVDLFASASPKDMDALSQKQLIVEATRKDFAGNTVVLIMPAHSKYRLNSFQDLTQEKVKRIAIGNPKTVPAGRYSEEVLIHFNLLESVKDRLIFAENVRQVLDYVARGEVDAGMVYATDARMRPKEVIMVKEAPQASHHPVVYPIAVIKGTKREKLTKEFIHVLQSEEGKKILHRYGFSVFGQNP